MNKDSNEQHRSFWFTWSMTMRAREGADPIRSAGLMAETLASGGVLTVAS